MSDVTEQCRFGESLVEDGGACTRPAEPIEHFPAVVGYCAEHGSPIATFLSLIDSRSPVGFDETRDRWRRGFNLLRS